MSITFYDSVRDDDINISYLKDVAKKTNYSEKENFLFFLNVYANFNDF